MERYFGVFFVVFVYEWVGLMQCCFERQLKVVVEVLIFCVQLVFFFQLMWFYDFLIRGCILEMQVIWYMFLSLLWEVVWKEQILGKGFKFRGSINSFGLVDEIF